MEGDVAPAEEGYEGGPEGAAEEEGEEALPIIPADVDPVKLEKSVMLVQALYLR
jgi:hypothetical protein